MNERNPLGQAREAYESLRIPDELPDAVQDAVRHPEEYRDLMVRVSGFSAFFVQLDPAIQNDILSRTEYDT